MTFFEITSRGREMCVNQNNLPQTALYVLTKACEAIILLTMTDAKNKGGIYEISEIKKKVLPKLQSILKLISLKMG